MANLRSEARGAMALGKTLASSVPEKGPYEVGPVEKAPLPWWKGGPDPVRNSSWTLFYPETLGPSARKIVYYSEQPMAHRMYTALTRFQREPLV